MILADTPCYTLYIADIELSPQGVRHRRHEREEAAVSALMREAFGPEAVRGHDSTGAPVAIVGGEALGCRISLSHSAAYAVLAVARGASDIGVDIEEPRTSLARVVERILGPDEREVCTDSYSRLRAWTMKEALYKASRRHFSFEPAFDTDLHLSGRAAGLDFCHEYIAVKDSIVAIVWR